VLAARRSARAGWVVASLQLAYVAWFLVCVWVVFALADHFAGHVYIPYQGDPYTADADVFSGWASLFWTPMAMTAVFQPFTVMAFIGLSVWQLAQPRIRANRVLFWTLVVCALLILGTFILAELPAGRSITGWILD
jgi:hypothetical protein